MPTEAHILQKNNKMKKPSKPYEPSKPDYPIRTFQQTVFVAAFGEKVPFNEILTKIEEISLQKSIPSKDFYLDVEITDNGYYDQDYGTYEREDDDISINLYYTKEAELDDHNWNTVLKRYNTQLNKYNAKVRIHRKKLEEYNIEIVKYEQFEKDQAEEKRKKQEELEKTPEYIEYTRLEKENHETVKRMRLLMKKLPKVKS